MKSIPKILCLTAIAFLSISTMKAQVKIGLNPTNISPYSSLEVQAVDSSIFSISKGYGTVTIISTNIGGQSIDATGSILVSSLRSNNKISLEPSITEALSGRVVFMEGYTEVASIFTDKNPADNYGTLTNQRQINYLASFGYHHYFGPNSKAANDHAPSGSVQIGDNSIAPTAWLHVGTPRSYALYPEDTIDVARFDLANTGDEDTFIPSRNIVLSNRDINGSKFGIIGFAPNATNKAVSGAEIIGVQRNEGGNNTAGIAFTTRATANDTLVERMRISQNGNIGIGITDPLYPLHFASGAFVDTNGNWTPPSDARLKTNIVATTYGLKEVMALRPVHYNMKRGGAAQVGFIAQEVRKVVPEVVSGIEGDILYGETLGLSYGNLVPVLTKAIQEQQSQIEALKAENKAYRAFVQGIKSEMADLKEQFGIKIEENQKAKK